MIQKSDNLSHMFSCNFLHQNPSFPQKTPKKSFVIAKNLTIRLADQCVSKEEALLSTAIREVKKIYDPAKMSKQDGYLPFMGGVWEA